MSEIQKVIKVFATAFAILLAVFIITAIASAGFAILSFVTGGKISFGNNKSKTVDVAKDFTDVNSLEIDNSTGTFIIKVGETFRIEAQNVSENFKAKVSDSGKLIISEQGGGLNFLWFDFGNFDNPNSKVTLYIPSDFVAKEAKLDTGAGTIKVEGLKAKSLKISTGAGNITGKDMMAEKVMIDGGVGNINLSNVDFKNTEFDCGVGNLNIDGILLGDNKIDCGVGDVDLDLKGNEEDYNLDVDSGIGSIKLNGEKISGSHKSNKGADNSIEIDGGVGDVRIDFEGSF